MNAARRPQLRLALLVMAATITLLPLLPVVLVAFNPPNTPITGASLPEQWSLSAFGNAWEYGRFGQALGNSAIVSFWVVLIVVVLATLAGYAFALLPFPGSKVIFYVILAGMAMPFTVMIIPLYFGFQSLRLANSHLGMILPEAGIYLAFGVFWMRAFFLSVPPGLMESARMDGAGSLRILTQILLPLARPALLTLSLLTFLSSWNEYLIPLVMASRQALQTAPGRLGVFQGQYISDIPSLAAAALIVAGPPILLYAMTQRTFFRGLFEGAIK